MFREKPRVPLNWFLEPRMELLTAGGQRHEAAWECEQEAALRREAHLRHDGVVCGRCG